MMTSLASFLQPLLSSTLYKGILLRLCCAEKSRSIHNVRNASIYPHIFQGFSIGACCKSHVGNNEYRNRLKIGRDIG